MNKSHLHSSNGKERPGLYVYSPIEEGEGSFAQTMQRATSIMILIFIIGLIVLLSLITGEPLVRLLIEGTP